MELTWAVYLHKVTKVRETIFQRKSVCRIIFLMFGTRPDNSGESLIIAQGTAEDLEEAVQFDAYYAEQLATYEIREYKVTLFNEAIKNYID